MQLCFKNEHSARVWVVAMWYDTDGCGQDGNWATRGWWEVNVGDTVHTNVWTANRYFYFYAEAEDGSVWGGPYGPVNCGSQAFDSCLLIDSTADEFRLGVREVDAGWWHWADITYTVNLT